MKYNIKTDGLLQSLMQENVRYFAWLTGGLVYGT